MIPVASGCCRAGFTRKPTRRFFRCAPVPGSQNKYASQICFSSSSDPPNSDKEQCSVKQRERRRHNSSGNGETPTHWPRARSSLQYDDGAALRTSNLRTTEQEKSKRPLRGRKKERKESIVHFSQYSYRIRPGNEIPSFFDSSDPPPQSTPERQHEKRVMQCMDASALLDPLKFCKRSAKLSPYVHSGSRSISGADAAKRLLRGKQDFLLAASELDRQPVMLDGHGVPLALFQHCVDMADALLDFYGPDSVECSFHNNYENQKRRRKAPHHVRVRRRDTSNVFLPPPSAEGEKGADASKVDWDYNFTLYLTVMERLAKSLGQVFELSSFVESELPNLANPPSGLERYDSSEEDFPPKLVSPLLWNVDIWSGAHFDFETVGKNGSKPLEKSRPIRPFPVVEFLPQQSSRSLGRVLIRLQGYPAANREFNGIVHDRQPVSLVFDACIQSSAPTRNLVE